MPEPTNTDPVYSDSVGITCVKWLKSLRTQLGQTDSDTVPNTNDPIGITLKKILQVYLRS